MNTSLRMNNIKRPVHHVNEYPDKGGGMVCVNQTHFRAEMKLVLGQFLRSPWFLLLPDI